MHRSKHTALWTLLVISVLMVSSACAGGSAGGGSGGTQGVTDKEIVIAAFGPLSGPSSWIGLGTRDGLLMAADEVNAAGGIHGRKLRVEYFDDRYQVAQAQTVVRRLKGDTKPFMIYSGTGSTVFVSVANLLRQSGLPVYNGFSGSPKARQDPEVETLFHGQAVSSTFVTTDLVKLLRGLDVKRVAVMHDVGEWGRSVCEPTIEALKAELNITPTTVQTYSSGAKDFAGQLVAVRNSKPQVVLNCGHYPEAGAILAQADQLGVKALFIGDTAQGNNSVWERAGASAENFLFNWYSPTFLTDPQGPMADFRAKYKARYPDAPAGRPAHSDTFAYGDGLIIAEALKRAGKDLTQEGFLKAMHSLHDFQPSPINAKASFDNPQNDGFQQTVWMRVKDGHAVLVDGANEAELKQLVAGY
jgi:branched-chain amino acid transport system substrate-binding protein